MMRPSHKSCNGFSLIEIMVAIVLLALSAQAFTRLAGQAIRADSQREERLVASWVAQNILTELRIQSIDASSVLTQRSQIPMMGRSWQVRIETSSTAMPNIQQWTIHVSPAASPDNEQASVTFHALLEAPR